MVSADEELRRQVVSAAVEHGIDFFDTAAAYGDGASERNLRKVLTELHVAAQVFTKVLVGESEFNDVRSAVVRSVEQSLERTGCQRFAGVTLHNRLAVHGDPRRQVGIGPVLTVDEVLGPGGFLAGLEQLRSENKVGFAGFTSLGGDAPAIHEVISSRRFDYINAVYGLLGPLDMGMPPITGADGYDVIRDAVSGGLDVIALRVFGGGLLLEPADDRRAAVTALRQWAEERNTTLPRLALRYALTSPDISALVVGFTQPMHVRDVVAAVHDGPLSEMEIIELTQLRARACPLEVPHV